MRTIFFALLFSLCSWAASYQLQNSQIEYQVKHLVKTVTGSSRDLKGKMVCENKTCQFLIAVPVKSFTSSDSNRDLNMYTILEAEKFQILTAKGQFPESELSKGQFSLTAKILFHGVEREYKLNLLKKGQEYQLNFKLLLEDHKIERPSLLTVKIDNEVPLAVKLFWAPL